MAVPLISIVIPLYNKAATVERALRSVEAQTVQDFEVVIVNDGSTDRSRETAEGILARIGGSSAQRVRIFDQENQGVSAARNRGIAEARADLVAFLDADDEWMPDFLETILRLRERFPMCDVFATGYLLKESEERRRPVRINGLAGPGWEGVLLDYFSIAAVSEPPLFSSAIAVTKRAMLSVGGFPVGVTSGEDLLTWARLAVEFQIAYSRRPVAVFRTMIKELPLPRRPQYPDVVGNGLAAICRKLSPDRKASAKRYLSLWHKMRGNCFLRLQDRTAALVEIRNALKFDRTAWVLYAYLAIALFPFPVGRLLSKQGGFR